VKRKKKKKEEEEEDWVGRITKTIKEKRKFSRNENFGSHFLL